MRARGILGWLALAATVVLIGQVAASAATVVPIATNVLNGPGPTTWDQHSDYGCDSSIWVGSNGYVPVEHGSYNGSDDGFDGGMALAVNGTEFWATSGNGSLSGNTISVGPTTLSGLIVTRKDTALSTSPTLRDLTAFKNPSGSPIAATIELDSNLGSDTATVDQLTSSGDKTFTTADHWVITTDTGPVGPFPGPPVTSVLEGKKAPTKFNTILGAPGVSGPSFSGYDCVTVRYTLKVPAHSTRYMMFFVQLHSPTDSMLTATKAAAAKFNSRTLSAALLKGVPMRAWAKIVNWKLT